MGRSLIHLQPAGRRAAVSEGCAGCNEAVGWSSRALCMAYPTELLLAASDTALINTNTLAGQGDVDHGMRYLSLRDASAGSSSSGIAPLPRLSLIKPCYFSRYKAMVHTGTPLLFLASHIHL